MQIQFRPMALAAIVWVAVGSATAQDQLPTDPDAILRAAADRLTASEAFSVQAKVAHDVVAGDGVVVTLFAQHEARVQRPGSASFQTQTHDGRQTRTLFNSSTLTQISVTDRLYASATAGPTLDDAVSFATETLDMALPLSMLARSDLGTRLTSQFDEATLVGDAEILGVRHHHLVMSNDAVDVQLWVTADAAPTLSRMTIIYNDTPGTPRFTAQFLDWNFAPEFTETAFSFAPGDGFERIEFLEVSPSEENQR